MNCKEIKRDEKRNKIFKDSLHLMYLNGYNGTSVKDITDGAGIPKGSFYNYFKDKQDYAVQAIDYYNTTMGCVSQQIISDKNLKPVDRIKGFFNHLIKGIINADYKCGCLVGNLSQELGDVDEVVSEALSRIDCGRITTIQTNLTEAKENGELHSTMDLCTLANIIVSTWQGSLVRMKMKKNKRALDDFKVALEELLK